MATLYIGHASIDENGNIVGGKSGDQTGKEVCKLDELVKNGVLFNSILNVSRFLMSHHA